MFNKATHVIGVNGAGLVHLLFAEPGTFFFEIQHIMIESTYYFISQIMNLNYVLCNLSTQDDFYNGHPMSKGKMVNLHVLKEFIVQQFRVVIISLNFNLMYLLKSERIRMIH